MGRVVVVGMRHSLQIGSCWLPSSGVSCFPSSTSGWASRWSLWWVPRSGSHRLGGLYGLGLRHGGAWRLHGSNGGPSDCSDDTTANFGGHREIFVRFSLLDLVVPSAVWCNLHTMALEGITVQQRHLVFYTSTCSCSDYRKVVTTTLDWLQRAPEWKLWFDSCWLYLAMAMFLHRHLLEETA